MTQGFDNVRLPEGINIKMRGGPAFHTAITVAESGIDQRNADWDAPLWKYVIHYVRKNTGFDPFISFFLTRGGRAKGFRFKDWSDFEVGAGQGEIRLVDGEYRLVKVYQFGSYKFYRVISRPITSSLTLPVGVTFDENTGVVSGGTSGSWTGEFDVPVRFDTDEMEFEMDPSGVKEWVDVSIIEIREY